MIDNNKALKKKFSRIKDQIRYLTKKWIYLLIAIIVGLVIAFIIDSKVEKVYIAETSFVLEESKESGALGGLAMQFGIGESEGSGLFTTTDNMIWLYGSQLMLERALLSSIYDGADSVILINYFIKNDSYIQEKLKTSPSLQKVSFTQAEPKNDLQVIMMRMCIGRIKSKYLEVITATKTMSILRVITTHEDELFAKIFTDRLVAIVNDFYVKTKSQKAQNDLAAIQNKVDEARANMTKSMTSVAISTENIPYLNPSMQTIKVEGQKQSVDAQLNTQIYLQLINSLESSKIALSKQSPLIQIVDSPTLPLPGKKIKLSLLLAVCSALMLIFTITFFMLKFNYNKIMNEK